MRGTFYKGDMLLVAPCKAARIGPGDVIVFRRSGLGADTVMIVHRVQEREIGGWLVRGDGVITSDLEPVLESDLVGRVCFSERKGKLHRVCGGPAGKLWVRYLRLRAWAANLLGYPYRLLRASSLTHRVWRPTLTQVRLVTTEGPVVKYLSSRRTVARWWPETGQFWCRKPYDLVISNPSAGDAQCQ